MRGSIRNLKAVEKIIHNCKTAKKIKTDKCSHPSSQNPNRSDTVLTSGNTEVSRLLRRSVEAHNGRLDRRENGIQIGQSETSSETRSVAH